MAIPIDLHYTSPMKNKVIITEGKAEEKDKR
jgi:hypothetical protein